jgi:diguanylate cyclase (GGDEF)-like protein
MSASHAIIQSLPSFSRFFRRIITPGELSKRSVSVISITIVLLAFIFDIITKENIRLGVLYLFPVSIMSIHNGRSRGTLLLVLLAILCQITVLLSFNISINAKIVESIIKPISIVLVFLLSLEVREMHLMIMDIAIKDDLTGVLSRKSFELILDQEITRQKRYGGVFSLAYLDLDDFKKLNDTKGHQIGDEALIFLAGVLRDHTRKTDFAGRMGGDEFALLMLHTDDVNCGTICLNLSEIIKSQMISAGFNITASIGYASFEQSPESLVDALTKVDKIMYAAKTNGKGSIAKESDLRF